MRAFFYMVILLAAVGCTVKDKTVAVPQATEVVDPFGIPDNDPPGNFAIASVSSRDGIVRDFADKTGITNYATAGDANDIRIAYEAVKLSLTKDGEAATGINSTMTKGFAELSAAFCRVAMVRERNSIDINARILFRGINLNATPAQGTLSNAQETRRVIQHLAGRFWLRNPTEEEFATLVSLASQLLPGGAPTAQDHRDLLEGLCTAIGAVEHIHL